MLVGKEMFIILHNRPHIIALYFPEPDLKGHSFGPDSSEVSNDL